MKQCNTQIGTDTIVEPNTLIGFAYHRDACPAITGKGGILRAGTIIYGDVRLGEYFQSGHHAVIRSQVECGGG